MITISDEDFAAWRNNPTTRQVMQYLDDCRERLKEMWADGVDMTPQSQAEALYLGTIVNLTNNHIRGFYDNGEETDDEEDE